MANSKLIPGEGGVVFYRWRILKVFSWKGLVISGDTAEEEAKVERFLLV